METSKLEAARKSIGYINNRFDYILNIANRGDLDTTWIIEIETNLRTLANHPVIGPTLKELEDYKAVLKYFEDYHSQSLWGRIRSKSRAKRIFGGIYPSLVIVMSTAEEEYYRLKPPTDSANRLITRLLENFREYGNVLNEDLKALPECNSYGDETAKSIEEDKTHGRSLLRFLQDLHAVYPELEFNKKFWLTKEFISWATNEGTRLNLERAFNSMSDNIVGYLKQKFEIAENGEIAVKTAEYSGLAQEPAGIVQTAEGVLKDTAPIRTSMKKILDTVNTMQIPNVIETLKVLAADLYGGQFKNKELGDRLVKRSQEFGNLPPEKSLKDRDMRIYELTLLEDMTAVKNFVDNYEDRAQRIVASS